MKNINNMIFLGNVWCSWKSVFCVALTMVLHGKQRSTGRPNSNHCTIIIAEVDDACTESIFSCSYQFTSLLFLFTCISIPC